MRIVLFLILVLLLASASPAQTGQESAEASGEGAASEPALDAVPLVREWFARLNALDDWSPDNAPAAAGGDPAPLVEEFVELYRPDAMQFVRPYEHQKGPVMYYEDEGVRHWATLFSRKYYDLAFRIEVQTAEEITSELFHTTPLPWGGLAVSVEFAAVYSVRDSGRKFMAPGAAFFQFAEDGRIQRLRLYILQDETFEVHP